jgi:alpha-N-arabinofuranosidase
MSELRKKNGHEEPWKIDYFGVGNENWGCGGNMTPEYYGNLYRNYQTYVRQYDPEKPIKKVCGGPNVDDANWTKKVLETTFTQSPAWLHGFMDGLSIHYYVHPGGWDHKGSATEFDNAMWYKTMKKALFIEHLINLHGTILNEYDPDKHVGFIMDEWGCWFDVEPGTNPGFLYQQNTMRDALVAATTLNIFNNHSDRVKMACIAQMINVLQSVILTEGPKMVKTPTYHVFHMYKGHQDADCVRSYIAENSEIGTDEDQVPALQVSASVKNGKYLVTVANMDVEKSYPVELSLSVSAIGDVKATIVHEEMHAKNTFDDPDAVCEKAFDEVKVADGKASFTIPACSVVGLTF